MGIEINRFKNPNQVEKFICNICLNVVDLEMKTANCEHLFCKLCIENHLEKDKSCPKCRVTFEARNVPILIKQIIEELEVACKFKCGSIIKYANIKQHEEKCSMRVCTVENGCNLNFHIEHNNLEGCVKNLKQFIKMVTPTTASSPQFLFGATKTTTTTENNLFPNLNKRHGDENTGNDVIANKQPFIFDLTKPLFTFTTTTQANTAEPFQFSAGGPTHDPISTITTPRRPYKAAASRMGSRR